jgi:hypothetical protein
MLGLQWNDVFLIGNAAGVGVGQAPFTTATFDGTTPHDANYTWEFWLQFPVADNISLTPALLYQSRPAGQNTPAGDTFNVVAGLVQLSFRF